MPETTDTIIIDGSYGEGGGSIIRFSLALAALTRKKLLLSNIRMNREKSGLRTQHLTGIQLIQQTLGGQLFGAKLGSTAIEYIPEDKEFSEKNNSLKVNVGTAASVGLIFQALQIAIIGFKADYQVDLVGGGTYGLWAPSTDYIREITLNYLKKFGYNFEIEVIKHGFYPKGLAYSRILYKISNSSSPKPLIISEGQKEISKIKIISIASINLKNNSVAERQANSAKSYLESKFNEKIVFEIIINYVDSISPGSGITIITDNYYPFGNSGVGKRGLPSEKVGEAIAKEFYDDFSKGGVIDIHATDQIIPFMALNPGSEIIVSSLSSHSKTNIWLCQKFLPIEFEINQLENNLIRLRSVKK